MDGQQQQQMDGQQHMDGQQQQQIYGQQRQHEYDLSEIDLTEFQ